MYSQVTSAAICGLRAHKVTVEADVRSGMPMFSIADFEVTEAPITFIVIIKNISIDTIIIVAIYLLLFDVNCLKARLGESALPLIGSVSLLSKNTSHLPPDTALIGDIVPTFSEMSII